MLRHTDRKALRYEVIRLADQSCLLIEAAVRADLSMSEEKRDYLLSGACFLPHIAREDIFSAVKEALALTRHAEKSLHKRWIALGDNVAKTYGTAPLGLS
jgi:hypothetical protein